MEYADETISLYSGKINFNEINEIIIVPVSVVNNRFLREVLQCSMTEIKISIKANMFAMRQNEDES